MIDFYKHIIFKLLKRLENLDTSLTLSMTIQRVIASEGVAQSKNDKLMCFYSMR